MEGNISEPRSVTSQQAQNVLKMLLQRNVNVMASTRHSSNIVRTFCVSWALICSNIHHNYKTYN